MSATTTHITVQVPLAIRKRPGRKTVVTPVYRHSESAVVTRGDPALLKAVARAFRYQRLLDEGRYGSVTEMATADRIERGYLGTLLRLTLLAPDIVEAIINGSARSDLTLPRLLEPLPAACEMQHAAMSTSPSASPNELPQNPVPPPHDRICDRRLTGPLAGLTRR